MADNVAITPGSGNTIAADEVTDPTLGSAKVQFVKIMDGTLDSTNKLVVDSHGSQQATLRDASGNPVDLTVGTAGSPAGGVSSVQGVVGMTPLSVHPLPVAPVSGVTSSMTATDSTAVTGIGAGGSGKFNYITQITVANAHNTVGTNVELQDGHDGATFYVIPAAAGYGGATLSFPTPLKQPTANTALFCKNSTTGSEIILSASGFQA